MPPLIDGSIQSSEDPDSWKRTWIRSTCDRRSGFTMTSPAPIRKTLLCTEIADSYTNWTQQHYDNIIELTQNKLTSEIMDRTAGNRYNSQNPGPQGPTSAYYSVVQTIRVEDETSPMMATVTTEEEDEDDALSQASTHQQSPMSSISCKEVARRVINKEVN